jgi:2-keto-4-pentenoate hydratase
MLKSITNVLSVLLMCSIIAGCGGKREMTDEELRDFAVRYTDAWNSGTPANVARFFSANGSLKVNDAEPAVGLAAITEVADGFMTAFPDMELTLLDLKNDGGIVQYHWRFVGTSTGPGGTGNAVDFSGYEEWTIGDDGLVARSLGNFDAADYQAQLDGTSVALLKPDSGDAEIVAHMMQHEQNQTQTAALAINFPDLTREHAYAIQRLRLEQTSVAEPHVGWKLGWTRLSEPGALLDPIVGHYVESRVYSQGESVSTRFFTSGTASAEPEIVFYLGKDLPGPVVTIEQLIDAIESVGIAMEFVNWRALEPRTREHAIADNGIAAGVVLANSRFKLSELDFSRIEGNVTVNGAISNSGHATSIMGEDPLAGLLWAANELPKYGMYLKAGQFVVSGTVCVPLPVSAGDNARISFTGMGSLDVEFY